MAEDGAPEPVGRFPTTSAGDTPRIVHGHGTHSPSTAALDGGDLLTVNFRSPIADPRLPFGVI